MNVHVHVQAIPVMKPGMPPAGVHPLPIQVAVPAAHASSPIKQHGHLCIMQPPLHHAATFASWHHLSLT